MRITRIYTPQPLQEGAVISLHENAANHVARVLRLTTDALLCLFNGEGGEYQARITAVTKRDVTVRLERFIPQDVGSALSIHLGQVISRGERMDFTLQKAVELGVTAITPLTSDFCSVKLQDERVDKKMAHWQGVITSACEQSGRTLLPTLHAPQSLGTWVSHCQARYPLILEPTAEKHLKQIPYTAAASEKTDFALLIGGEGGLSEKEIQLATAHQFLSIQLGPRILRTETAGLAVIAGLQTLFGDLG